MKPIPSSRSPTTGTSIHQKQWREEAGINFALAMNHWGDRDCITVYESVQGELIASIEFHTKADHELDFCLVEQSLSLEDIADLIVCQDPTEHIDRIRLRKQDSGDSERFLKAVFHDYDLLGIEIERQMQDFVPCEPEVPLAKDQAKKKSVWSNWNPFASDKQRS